MTNWNSSTFAACMSWSREVPSERIYGANDAMAARFERHLRRRNSINSVNVHRVVSHYLFLWHTLPMHCFMRRMRHTQWTISKFPVAIRSYLIAEFWNNILITKLLNQLNEEKIRKRKKYIFSWKMHLIYHIAYSLVFVILAHSLQHNNN